MEGSNETVSSGAAAPASTGPTTFADVSWTAEDSSASEPSQSTENAATAEQSLGTSEQQAAPAEDRSPFIPRARFDEVNTKYGELKQWKEQYGWAEQVNRQQVEDAVKLAQRYTGDPIAFLQELAAEVQSHPEHGAKLTSWAAQQLGAARRQQAETPAPALDYNRIEIDLGNGQAVSLGDLKQQWMAEVDQKYQPAMKTVQQVTQERAQQAADTFATSTYEQLSKQLPDFAAHGKEIGERLEALKLQTNDPAMLTLAVKAIYADVVTPKREQQLSSKAQSQLLDNLQHKAQASSSVNPGSAAPSTPRTVSSFHQLGPEAWRD